MDLDLGDLADGVSGNLFPKRAMRAGIGNKIPDTPNDMNGVVDKRSTKWNERFSSSIPPCGMVNNRPAQA